MHILTVYTWKELSYINILRLKVACLVLNQNTVFILILELRKWHIIFIVSYTLWECEKNIFLIFFPDTKFVLVNSKLHWVHTQSFSRSLQIGTTVSQKEYDWNFTGSATPKAALATQGSLGIARHWSLLSSLVICAFFFFCPVPLEGFPGGGKEFGCQCRKRMRQVFSSWVGKIPWRRKWQPTPVFLPGESHGQRNTVGCSPWGCKESDTLSDWARAHTHTSVRAMQKRSGKWCFHPRIPKGQESNPSAQVW